MRNKKAIALAIILTAGTVFTACGGNTAGQTSREQSETAAAQSNREQTSQQNDGEPQTNSGKTLVVYFSATGTTKGVAEKIAKITNADLYEIKAAQEYTSADLDWHDRGSRTTKEQNDKSARAEIAGDKPALDGYTTVYIGYPIWWGEEPRIMDTFVESCSFDGITVIPFCTSGGSGIGRSGKNLEENAGSGIWLDGERLSAGVSEQELQSRIGSLE